MIICEPNSLCHFNWAQNWVPVNVEGDVSISVCNRLFKYCQLPTLSACTLGEKYKEELYLVV